MKRMVVFFVFLFLSSCSLDSVQEESTVVQEEITPVYVTINSHNENTWKVDSPPEYLAYRKDLLERLAVIQEYDAKLNWESDYAVLLAMQDHENGDLLLDTNHKNILRYMVEDLEFSVDPHLHPGEYNYADLAYLIEQLGVEPSGVIGGLIVKDCVAGQQIFTDWHETLELDDDGYVYGKSYPEYRWKPEILSGAGSSGHSFDDLSSGMWHPGNGDAFYEDQGEGIVLVGQGYDHDASLLPEPKRGELYYEDGGYIKELVEKIQSGELSAGKMYTANLHVQDKEYISIDGRKTNDALREVLEELQPYVDAGYIQYVSYQEAVDIWKEKYHSEVNQVSIDIFSEYENIKAQENC